MTDEILSLNSNNELVAKDPSTGNTRPIKVADLSASGDVTVGGSSVVTDALAAISGQQITPTQTGTSTNPTTVVASSATVGGSSVITDALAAISGQQITPSQTGTSTNPTTVVADSVTEGGNNVVTSPNSDRDVFVIAKGASDPAEADADDIILEKA